MAKNPEKRMNRRPIQLKGDPESLKKALNQFRLKDHRFLGKSDHHVINEIVWQFLEEKGCITSAKNLIYNFRFSDKLGVAV